MKPIKKSRTESRRERTNARLLKSAHELMSAQGVEATTIQEITDAADVGFGTFYSYFQSKNEIANRVLDCTIHNLGMRNDAANKAAGITDAALVVCNSLRLVIRETMSNKMWRWWLARPDLIIERMREGFGPFGLRDIEDAVKGEQYSIINGDSKSAWSDLVCLLAGGIKDIVDGHRSADSADHIAESIMRVMGVPLAQAKALSIVPLPDYPDLPIDFDFSLKNNVQPADETIPAN